MRKYKTLIFLFSLALLSFGCQSNRTEQVPATIPVVTAIATEEKIQNTEASPVDATETATFSTTATVVETDIQNNKPEQFPDSTEYSWKQVVTKLTRPLGMAALSDDSGRLLILEQEGVIRLIDNEKLIDVPFLDIRDRINIQGSEQGLLGIALAPDFIDSGIFYINYTDLNGDSVIARYQAAEDLNTALPDSEKILISQKQPYQNHNGGNLAFGLDGFLYAGLGDGGSGGDPQKNAQNTNTWLGKILRIAVTDQSSYAIPSDNPYVNGGGKSEIWAIGLRNPWRFSFDRLTGDLYIADVGQGSWEEIDFLPAGTPPGENFGWNYREGKQSFEGSVPQNLVLIDPITEYGHDQGCSVTGGFVYRGPSLPEWNGVYFFGDYCSGTIWGTFQDSNGVWQVQTLFQTNENISSFGEDASGELYLIGYGGSLFKLSKN
jgi:glucose/arabinose dehydrogenase